VAKEIYSQYESIKQILENSQMDTSNITDALEEMERLESLKQTRTRDGTADVKSILESARYWMELGILELFVKNAEELSNAKLDYGSGILERNLQKGNGSTYEEGDISDRLFFTAYLQETFTDLTNGDETHALLYELEYLLGGKESDQANLEAVCKKILTVRTVINYAYLLSDSGRQAEAEALALAICSLLTVPEITEVAKQAILLAWAYGESIVDVRVLLKGNKVPLVKDGTTWQLQLANLVKLGTSEEVTSEKPSEMGRSYEDYLKGFLLLEKKETLCMRSLDLVEINYHIQTDQCITWVKVKSCAELPLGIRDTFTTTFGYQ
jgi:hypothetical protein